MGLLTRESIGREAEKSESKVINDRRAIRKFGNIEMKRA